MATESTVIELEFHQLALTYENQRIKAPGCQARLMASLLSQGQLNPVLVVNAKNSENRAILIDGYRRVSALKALKRDTVQAMVLPLGEAEALIFRHSQEKAHPRSALEDAWLLSDLILRHGLKQAELALKLERSESWISRRLSLVNDLPETVQALVQKGKLESTLAMKYLVPLARGKKKDCETLALTLSGHPITTRQMELIYKAWRRGDLAQREQIVHHPLLFLKTLDALGGVSDHAVSEEEHDLTDDLALLLTVSRRALRRVRYLDLDKLSHKTWELWHAGEQQWLQLERAMHIIKETCDVGQGLTDDDFKPQGEGTRHSEDSSHPRDIPFDGETRV